MKTYPMIIDGQTVNGGKTLTVINPATGEGFAKVHDASPEHVDAAVAAARAAFPSWSALPDAGRKAKLHALGAALEANMPELMELVTRETGKPLQGLTNVGAGMELGGATSRPTSTSNPRSSRTTSRRAWKCTASRWASSRRSRRGTGR